jgi:hypothetical protein
MATCPDCDFDEIDTEDFEDGDTLSCPECGKGLVVRAGDVDVADEDDDEEEDDEEEEEDDDEEDDDEEEEEKDEEQ